MVNLSDSRRTELLLDNVFSNHIKSIKGTYEPRWSSLVHSNDYVIFLEYTKTELLISYSTSTRFNSILKELDRVSSIKSNISSPGISWSYGKVIKGIPSKSANIVDRVKTLELEFDEVSSCIWYLDQILRDKKLVILKDSGEQTSKVTYDTYKWTPYTEIGNLNIYNPDKIFQFLFPIGPSSLNSDLVSPNLSIKPIEVSKVTVGNFETLKKRDITKLFYKCKAVRLGSDDVQVYGLFPRNSRVTPNDISKLEGVVSVDASEMVITTPDMKAIKLGFPNSGYLKNWFKDSIPTRETFLLGEVEISRT